MVHIPNHLSYVYWKLIILTIKNSTTIIFHYNSPFQVKKIFLGERKWFFKFGITNRVAELHCSRRHHTTSEWQPRKLHGTQSAHLSVEPQRGFPCSFKLSSSSDFIQVSQQEKILGDHVHPWFPFQFFVRPLHTLQHTQKALRGFSPSQPLLPQSRKRSMNCVYKSLWILESRTRITFSSLAGRWIFSTVWPLLQREGDQQWLQVNAK